MDAGLQLTKDNKPAELRAFLDSNPDYNIDKQLTDGNTLLIIAAEKGYPDIAKVLLDKGAEVDRRDVEDFTALYIASAYGYIDTVRVLLDRGADVNYPNSGKFTALYIASENGHTDIVKMLLDKGADVNYINDGKFTALYHASDNGHADIVKLLLDKGADVNYLNDENFTALYIASDKGYIDVVKIILEKSVEIDRLNKGKYTSLYIASENGHAEIVKMLLEKGANVNYLNDSGKFTALYAATKNRHADVVRVLLDKGANVNSLNDRKFTCLYLASEKGYVPIVKILLDNGADANYLNFGKYTALYIASENNHINVVKVLLENGADVDYLNDGVTALYIAAKNENVEVIKTLLDMGAEVDFLNIESSEPLLHVTALYVAAREGQVEAVKAILEKNPEIDRINRKKYTALAAAAIRGHPDVIKVLLDAGAVIDYLNENDSVTALYLAAIKGNTATVKVLLDAGAQVDFLNNDGKFTALFIASENGYADVVKILLEKGADVNYLNNEKITSLYIASEKGHADVVKILLEKGADVNYLNNENFTALYVASLKGHEDVVKLLLEKGANVNIVIKGKSILDRAKTGQFIPKINELIKKASKPPGKLYKGVTRSNIEKFNIFLAIPDYPPSPTEDQKKTAEENAKTLANNTSLCPICLSYSERSMGCLYMHHTCPVELRHEDLYQKYKGSEGHIWWCTDCGRICTGHKHHALGFSGSDIPKLLPSSNPFSKKCNLTEGGGSLEEKLRRISRMIEFYADLQVSIQEGGAVPSEEEVRNMIVEETWNGALIRTFINPQTVKRWRTSLDVFPSEAPPSVTETTALVVPAGVFEEPKLETGFCSISLDEGVPVMQFRHKNASGQMFDHIYDGEKRFICKAALIEHLRTSGGDTNGKCYDVDCGGYLWPPEVRKAFELFGPLTAEDETLLKNYEERFPREGYGALARGGGGKRLPALNTLLRPLNNEQCFLKKGGRRTHKRQKGKRETQSNRKLKLK